MFRPHQIRPDGTSGSVVADGDYSVSVAGGAIAGLVAAGGGGGGTGWDNTLTLPGTTLTGWTLGTGTWSASAAGIRQADTTNGTRRARYATRVRLAGIVAEMDVKIDTAPNTTNSRAGFLIGMPFSSDGTGGLLCVFRCATAGFITGVYWENEGIVAGPYVAFGTPVALGTTLTLRVHLVGGSADVYVNGTFHANARIDTTVHIDGALALYSYATDVTFSNLDVWAPTLP